MRPAVPLPQPPNAGRVVSSVLAATGRGYPSLPNLAINLFREESLHSELTGVPCLTQ